MGWWGDAARQLFPFSFSPPWPSPFSSSETFQPKRDSWTWFAKVEEMPRQPSNTFMSLSWRFLVRGNQKHSFCPAMEADLLISVAAATLTFVLLRCLCVFLYLLWVKVVAFWLTTFSLENWLVSRSEKAALGLLILQNLFAVVIFYFKKNRLAFTNRHVKSCFIKPV